MTNRPSRGVTALGGLVLVFWVSAASAEEPSNGPTAPVAPVPTAPATTEGATAPAPVASPNPPPSVPGASSAPPSGPTTPVATSGPIPAQPAYVPWGPPPTPPPAQPLRGHEPYVHDGFFARLAVGPGLFRAWTSTSPDTRHFSGGAVAGELSLGGTPGKGFVIGGSVLLNSVFALSSKDDVIDGDEPSLAGVSFSLDAVGPFVDFYPDPKSGLDFHFFLGTGWLATTRPGAPNVDEPSGIVVSGGGGYDWFVAEQLSLGVHARLTVGSLSVNESSGATSTSVTALVPALLVAGTYH
jgi:hypothetical protein